MLTLFNLVKDPSPLVLNDESDPLLEFNPSSIQNSVDLAWSNVNHDGLPAHPSVDEMALSVGTCPAARQDGEQEGVKSSVVTLPLYEETYSTLAA